MLDALANLVIRHRAAIFISLVVATVGLGVFIPQLEVDPSVDDLVATYEGEEARHELEARFVADFGDTDEVFLILVEAPDVLEVAPLQYMHDLAAYARSLPWMKSVVNLTDSPLPRRVSAPAEDAPGGFGDLEEELGGDDGLGDDELGDDAGGDDDLGGFAALEDELGDDEGDEVDLGDDFDPATVDALVSLVEADPGHFPQGFSALGTALQQELVVAPIVDGDTVTAEDVEEIRTLLAQSPMLEGRLISRDRTVLAMALYAESLPSNDLKRETVALGDYIESHQPGEGMRVHVGGLPFIRGLIMENIQSDNIRLVPLTLLVCILVLAYALRWLPGVILPIVAVGLTALMVVGGMAMVGEKFNVLNNVIPVLLIIIGISDSVHLIARYREEQPRCGYDREKAGRVTVKAMAVACLLTSVTTAVGLASLAFSRTAMLQHFGVDSAIGVMVAYVVTITFLPAVLTWVKAPPPRKASSATLEIAIMRLTTWVLNRPWHVLVVTAVLIAVSGYSATFLKVDHALLDQFSPDDPISQTTRLVENRLNGVRPLEIGIRASEPNAFDDPATLAAIDEVAAWALEHEIVVTTSSQNDILRESLAMLADEPAARSEPFVSAAQVHALATILHAREPSPLDTWVGDTRDHMRLQLMLRDSGAQAMMAFIRELKVELHDTLEARGLTVFITGEAYIGSQGIVAVVNDLLSSLLLAVVIIFALLTFLFRSVRLGLLSIPPNILPLVGTMAYMVYRDIPLNAATAIIYSISLGLAVDGSIHVLARFREETNRGFRAHPALVRAARGTGRAIVVSGVTLMAGFGVLLFSNFVPVQRFGELIAVTVGSCLVSTLLLLPALLKVAGLSRKQRRAHAAADAALKSAASKRD